MTTIRIALPAHLRTLAKVEASEVEIAVGGGEPVTLAAALDALEMCYPVLRGTIRDHTTKQRRPFLRFFACEQDLSLLDPTVTALPEAVLSGAEPLFVVGAIAGGC
jgi:hypothetical protein